jgi:glutamate carboxypeptidase
MERVHQLNVDPEVTFNVGRVNGGGPLNVVPELAIGRVNVRVKTTQQMNRVEQQLSSLARTFGERDGYSVQCVGRFTSPPKEVTAEMAELQLRVELCGQVLNQTIAWQGTGGASDGNKFAAAGLANVDSLGPIGGNIHSSDEFVVSASLVPAAKLAALILLSFSR